MFKMAEYVKYDGKEKKEDINYKNFKRLQKHNYILFTLHLIIVLYAYFTLDNEKLKSIVMLMYGISGFLMSMVLNMRLSLTRRRYKIFEDMIEDIKSKKENRK